MGKSMEACESRGLTSVGLPECVWSNFTMGCRAYPMALEFEILEYVGVDNPDVKHYIRQALDICGSYTNETLCNERCATGLAPPGLARAVHPHIVLSALVFIL